MITDTLRREIEQEINHHIVSIAPLSAANNAQIYRLTLGNNVVLVAKVAENDLEIEAFMLKYLREKSSLPVPGVHYANDHVIVMDYIPSQAAVDDQAAAHAADLLAALHQVRGTQYGFECDTHFWSLPQANPQGADWAYFYAEHRMIAQAKAAQKEERIDAKMMKQVEKLASKIGNYIKDPAPPSLIHGDIWNGNVLSGRGRILAFLDPAIYYADPEIELAYIRQFNVFQGAFFSRYHDLNPIKPGFFEERADLYAIYPLLIQARLFGASYARKVQKILDRFA